MDEHSLDSHFTGFTDISDHIEQPHLLDGSHFLDEVDNNSVDLTTLIEQSLTPLSVGNIINTMNHNNSYIHQQYEQQISQQPPTLSPLNHVNMYQLLSGNMNIGGMPVIIVNLPQQAVVSPATPSAEMSHLNIQEQKQQIISQPPPQPIAGIHPNIRNIQEEEEPPFKKRRPSVVDENDMDLMALSHQMDLLRRNSLPVLHSIHVPPRLTIQPSVSVDELISPSKFIRHDDIDLLEDYESGGEVISLLNEDGEEDAAEQAEDSPPSHNTNPFNFGNFYTSAPPAKNEFSAPLQPLQIPTGKSEAIEVQTAPTPTTDQPKKNRRRKSTPGGETPNNTPGTPDGRKLVCLGKRPRKNKKTQPEDQFLMKFTMRRNK